MYSGITALNPYVQHLSCKEDRSHAELKRDSKFNMSVKIVMSQVCGCHLMNTCND